MLGADLVASGQTDDLSSFLSTLSLQYEASVSISFGGCACGVAALLAILKLSKSADKVNKLVNNNFLRWLHAEDSEEWSCRPKTSPVYHHRPLVVFAEPRTGSNLLFGILKTFIRAAPQKDVEIMTLYELFTKDGINKTSAVFANAVKQAHASVSSNCKLLGNATEDTKERKRILAEISEYQKQHNHSGMVDMVAVQAKRFGLDHLVNVTRNRYINPKSYFGFLRNVP